MSAYEAYLAKSAALISAADLDAIDAYEHTLSHLEKTHGGCMADHVRELSKGDRQITRARVREAFMANQDKQASDDWKTRPGVRAVVHDEQGRVLLLKRPKDEELHPGTWNLPGGAKETDENHLEGAHRELKEETGLSAHATGEHHVFKFPGGQGKAYKMYLQSGKAKLNLAKKEVECARWFAPDDLPENLFPNTQKTVRALAKAAALLPDVKLRAHQEEADKRYNEGNGQILLAHDAGTGKTLSYLALHERRKAKGLAHKALVVTPAALEENFTEQGVHKFTDSTVTSVHRHGPVPNADYYTVSLEKFRTDPVGYMKRTGADSLIVDELHKARDPGSLNYKAIMAARAHAKNFIGGTGTPIMNHPHDIVPLLDMVTDKHHGLGTHERGSTFKPMNPKAFDVNFLEEKTQHHGALGFLGIGPTSTTTQLKNQSYLQRQLKNHIHHVGVDELGADMPIKKLHNVEVEMSTHQSKLYEFAMGQLDPLTRFKIKHNLPVGKAEAAHVFTRITQARQASNALHPLDRNHTAASSAEATPKARRVLDDVHAHLAADPKNKAIIYTNLVHGGVDQMVAGLQRRGHDPGLFIGSKHQKKSERSTHVADYLSGKRRVMIMNQAGTEGVNLPGTTAHFTLDPHFNPMQTMQAEARGIRAGSPVHQVDVYRYRSVAKKPLGFLPRETSTDEWVQGVADKKDDLNKQFMKLMG